MAKPKVKPQPSGWRKHPTVDTCMLCCPGGGCIVARHFVCCGCGRKLR